MDCVDELLCVPEIEPVVELDGVLVTVCEPLFVGEWVLDAELVRDPEPLADCVPDGVKEDEPVIEGEADGETEPVPEPVCVCDVVIVPEPDGEIEDVPVVDTEPVFVMVVVCVIVPEPL